MKLAVLADIHGNFIGLQTVAAHIEAWQPDLVVVAGDIVNRGPRSLDCLRFVQAKQQSDGWLVVRGNHEDYVIGISNPDIPWHGPKYEFYRPVYWTYEQLGKDISALETMPLQLSLTAPDGGEICITHASKRGNRDGIFPDTPDDVLRQQIAPPIPLICVGHTHQALIRHIDNTLVVNVGSAGLPFDTNPQIAYAQLCWHHNHWQAEIVRLDYDRRQAERDIFETGFHEEGGPIVDIIIHELQNARSLMFGWAHKYEKAILSERLTVRESVTEFLDNLS